MNQTDATEIFQIADRLHSAAIRLLRRLRQVDPATGIGPAQLSALSVVVFGGPVTLGELADIEQVRPPTMSRIIDHLESKELVVRKRSESDRRVVHVMATDAGAQIMSEGRNRRVTLLSDQLKELSQEKRSTLKNAVTILESLSA
jgi:DNA-binding MarR family transcriptional regulator